MHVRKYKWSGRGFEMHNLKFLISTGEDLFPQYITEADRKQLKERIKNNEITIKCGCKPSANFFYGISEDLKIYPLHKNYVHDIQCCRYKNVSDNQIRNSAYQVDDQTGTVMVYTKFDPRVFTADKEPAKKEKKTDETDDEQEKVFIEKSDSEKEAVEKEPKFSLEDLVRAINVATFSDNVFKKTILDSHTKFSKCVYHQMKTIYLDRLRKSIGELSLEEDGVRFIYQKYSRYINENINGAVKSHIITTLNDKEYNNYIFPNTAKKCLTKYNTCYGEEPGENTYIAGFQYLKSSQTGTSYRVLGRVHLFLVSEGGIFCRNKIEFDTYNILERFQRDGKIKFYIPPEDQDIGAVVEIPGRNKKLLILFNLDKPETVRYDANEYEPVLVSVTSPLNILYYLNI